MGSTATDQQPLSGVRVVVTRAEGADGPLSRRLAERGAEVLNWPVIGFEPPEDPARLNAALASIADYDWIVFTSPRAVAAVEERVQPPREEPQSERLSPPSPSVAAVGAATAGRLRRAGWPVDLGSESVGARGLLEAFADRDCNGLKVLLPGSDRMRQTLPGGLAALGAEVDPVVAYRTVGRPLDRAECLAALNDGDPPIVTFASPSAVAGLRSTLGRRGFARLLARCPAVVIGETTGRALTDAGFSPTHTASPGTLAGLARAVERVAQEVRTP